MKDFLEGKPKYCLYVINEPKLHNQKMSNDFFGGEGYCMPAYNKLVRDKIPQMIAAGDLQFRTRILDETEYKHELVTKLREEVHEYFQSSDDKQSLEELADILEVVRALATVHGSDPQQLEEIRK